MEDLEKEAIERTLKFYKNNREPLPNLLKLVRELYIERLISTG